MNRCALIIPYFGRFDNYFQLYLDSCGKNRNFDWIILTDDQSSYHYPPNVHVIYCTFGEIRDRVQNYFDFKISLDTPYDLCDFKPAYGVVFKDLLRSYEFWGHCDTDLIWGDIGKFITDSVFDAYDKIQDRGHLTIYRNCEYMNTLFLSDSQLLFVDYHYAYTTKYCCHFDETYAWRDVLRERKIPHWSNAIFADVDCNHYAFRLVYGEQQNCPQIFEYYNGQLFRHYIDESGELKKDYWCYIHLQKRTMTVICENYEHFLIVPNKFIPYQPINKELIKQFSDNHFYWTRKKKRMIEIVKNIKYGALDYRIKKFRKKIKSKR